MSCFTIFYLLPPLRAPPPEKPPPRLPPNEPPLIEPLERLPPNELELLKLPVERLVVVLTKPVGYVKKPMSKSLTRVCYGHQYPKFARKVRERHVMYNATTARLTKLEQEGKVLVLRPSQRIKISRVEKHPEKLQALYDVGVRDAQAKIEQIRRFLADTGMKK